MAGSPNFGKRLRFSRTSTNLLLVSDTLDTPGTMARATNPSKRAKSFSKKKSNIAGYAKRKSLKGKTLADASDVYEYQPEKVRRAKVKLLLEKDELQDGGKDDSDAEGSVSRRARPRLVGEVDEDDRIGSDEDEEIDSDAAFDESDEEQFAGLNFSRSKVCTQLCLQEAIYNCSTEVSAQEAVKSRQALET